MRRSTVNIDMFDIGASRPVGEGEDIPGVLSLLTLDDRRRTFREVHDVLFAALHPRGRNHPDPRL